MANVTVEQLATEIGTPVERLVSQLADSGVNKSATDSVSQEEKEALLGHLKKQHGDDSTANPSKMTLSRKKKSTLVLGHGSKAKSVQVEVRKKRTYVKRSDLEEQQQADVEFKATEEARIQAEIDLKAKAEADAKEVVNALAVAAVKAEVQAEAKVEADAKAKQAAVVKAKNIDESAAKPVPVVAETEEAKKLRLQQDAELAAKVEEEARLSAEVARKLSEENESRWKEQEAERKAKEKEVVHLTSSKYAQEAEDKSDSADESGRRRKKKKPAGQDRNNRGRNARGKGKSGLSSPQSLKHGFTKPVEIKLNEVRIGETISVAELANKMSVKGAEVVKAMFKMGAMATINQVIDQETAALVAEDMGREVVLVKENALEEAVLSDRDHTGEAITRA
ncbi:MAG: translation initiation factor IF-2, partial [Cognaticolwellia sp.]